MSGIHDETGVVLARHALFAAVQTALADETNVDIGEGFIWPVAADDWFAVTDVDSSIETNNIGARVQLRETITLSVSVGSWAQGNDHATEVFAFDRAFALLKKVQRHIRTNDITLGGTVLWCVPGSMRSAGETTESTAGQGRLTEIAATFVCEHRIKG